MDERRWKVGELAEATGVTVRTLHHFDVIGLLRPAERSAGGHRLYTSGDVRRLYQVLALRHLGMPLADIARALDGDGEELGAAVCGQLEHVEHQLRLLQELRRRLTGLARAVQGSREPSPAELIEVMEATMNASYFTPEQLARARARHQEPGFAQTFARWQEECAGIVRELAGHLRAGVDPADPAVQRLARRWQQVLRELGRDDAGVSALYARIEGKGPEAATRGILTADVWDYLRQAFAVGFGAPG